MVEPIYCLKPAWCGRHLAGLRPETGLTVRYGATAFKAVGCHSIAVESPIEMSIPQDRHGSYTRVLITANPGLRGLLRARRDGKSHQKQFSLFSDRTSTACLRSNQLRLYLFSIAYLLLEAFRRLGLNGTAMARAQCQTIRLKLLKVGALVRVTVRKVWVSFSSGYPDQVLFARVFQQLHC